MVETLPPDYHRFECPQATGMACRCILDQYGIGPEPIPLPTPDPNISLTIPPFFMAQAVIYSIELPCSEFGCNHSILCLYLSKQDQLSCESLCLLFYPLIYDFVSLLAE